jgi:hypothetical protein
MNRVGFLKFTNVKRLWQSEHVDILVPISEIRQIMIFKDQNKVIFDTRTTKLVWRPEQGKDGRQWPDVHTYINKELSSGKTIVEFN